MRLSFFAAASGGLALAAMTFGPALAMPVQGMTSATADGASIIKVADSGWASRAEGRRHVDGPRRKYFNGRYHYYGRMGYHHHRRYY